MTLDGEGVPGEAGDGRETEGGKKDRFLARLSPYRRRAWFPIAEERRAPPTASKFSGIPFIKRGEDWPCCPNCEHEMALFAQINAGDLPTAAAKPFGPGILQVFYCTTDDPSCEEQCEAMAPFAESTLVRVVPGTGMFREFRRSPVIGAFPERAVVTFEAWDDYPEADELEEMGTFLDASERDLYADLGYPQPGDKLFGWPTWLAGTSYPRCPDCDEPMAFLLQLESGDNLPFEFGDQGCALITRCPQHPHRLTVSWA